jgi:hypothetical protein
MVGDLTFIFRATSLTRFTIGVSAAGVQVYSESAKERGKFERSWDVAFADLAGATVFEWVTRRGKGEAVYLHKKQGGTVMFSTTSGALGKDVTEADRAGYEAATAAVFKALAAVRPDILVRKGRAPGDIVAALVIQLTFAGVLSGLFWWQSAEASDSYRWSIVALIVAMTLLYCVSRLKLFRKPVFASAGEVATAMARRLPASGPWGAAPRAHSTTAT